MAIEVIKLLITVGQVFSGGLKDRIVWNRDRRDRVAELFDKIADCLTIIAESLRKRHEPRSRCRELEAYLKEFRELAGKHLDKKTTLTLETYLDRSHSAYAPMPASLIVFSCATEDDFDQRADEVEEVVGIFRATANLMRAK